jgi:aminopeptidase YwaD
MQRDRSLEEKMMSTRTGEHLRELVSHPDRHVGGPGNRAATEYFARYLEDLGFHVSKTQFDCIEWEFGDAVIETADEVFSAQVGPYSEALDARAVLSAASSVEQLESEAIGGTFVLLHGDLAKSQIMPRNFTFYNPESHRRIIRALDDFAPAAVVAATGRDPQMVGSQYPFPLFEDGDLGLPSAYLTDRDGARLLDRVGQEVRLRIDSRRIPTVAQHVVATLPGGRPGRIVVSAHIDSRKGSPGALDNASGVAVLLALAELLDGTWVGPTLEFVPFNGEDNYANPGEMLWVAQNEGRFDDIVLGINIDDLGMRGTTNHVSFYGCPPPMESTIRDVMVSHPDVREGPQWFQSDHAIFSMKGRPAIAMASSDIEGFMARYAHSERDTLELVDPTLIDHAARFLLDVLAAM